MSKSTTTAAAAPEEGDTPPPKKPDGGSKKETDASQAEGKEVLPASKEAVKKEEQQENEKENNKLHEEKKALDKAKEFDLLQEEESKEVADSDNLPMFSDINEESVAKDEETKVSNDDIAARHHAATRIADSELPELPAFPQPLPQIVAPMSHQLQTQSVWGFSDVFFYLFLCILFFYIGRNFEQIQQKAEKPIDKIKKKIDDKMKNEHSYQSLGSNERRHNKKRSGTSRNDDVYDEENAPGSFELSQISSSPDQKHMEDLQDKNDQVHQLSQELRRLKEREQTLSIENQILKSKLDLQVEDPQIPNYDPQQDAPQVPERKKSMKKQRVKTQSKDTKESLIQGDSDKYGISSKNSKINDDEEDDKTLQDISAFLADN